MNLKKVILTSNDCYRRGLTIRPRGIMWHSTGCNNPALRRYVQPDVEGIGRNKYQNDWNHPGLKVCVHAFIGRLENGEVAVVQTLPWNHRGWHCAADGNNTHISFEMCEDGKHDRDYFLACWRSAVELTAMLCRMYSLDPLADGVVIDHGEGHRRGIASDHADVQHWSRLFGKSMDDARREVAFYMKHGYHEEDSPATGNKPKPEPAVREKRYHTVGDLKADENALRWYWPTVDKLIRNGLLQGAGGTGDQMILDLGSDAIRVLVCLDRAKLFG